MAPPSLLDHKATYLQPPPPYQLRSSSTPGSVDGDSSESDNVDANRLGSPWLAPDPRAGSTQSLVPSAIDIEIEPGNIRKRRVLLLVYIHGFYGTTRSFQSFPYHVHTFLQTALAETHAVHTKIYPRYKCYNALEVARDNFSAWITPHESPDTDIILVGHSMGGLLAADIALMPNTRPYQPGPFKHRILGTVSLDAPLLGLHPGIVVSGLASLFAPKPESPKAQPAASPTAASPPHSGRSSNVDLAESLNSVAITDATGTSGSLTLQDSHATDTSFNPPFWNDNEFKEQPFLKRLKNFAYKHKAEGIYGAIRNHVVAHVEFGSTVADYPALHQRYHKIRQLEDVDEIRLLNEGHPREAHARVRFINYYTLSTGRHDAPKSPNSGKADFVRSRDISPLPSAEIDAIADSQIGLPPMQTLPPPIVDHKNDGNDGYFEARNVSDDEEVKKEAQSPSVTENGGIRTPEGDSPVAQDASGSQLDGLEFDQGLPPIPDPPTPPALPSVDQFTDKSLRKQAEKEYKRLQRAYEQAVKDREKAVRERGKLILKRQKKAEREARKKAGKSHRDVEKKSSQSPTVTATTPPASEPSQAAPTPPEMIPNHTECQKPDAKKPKKLRKFCQTPRLKDGVPEPTWVDVFMDGVDEVTAHTGLFFPGMHYDRLVGDMSCRIMAWVQEDMSTRTVLDAMTQVD